MTKIFLKNYRIRGKHGVYEYERNTDQDFVFDIVATTNTAEAHQSDNIQDTVNYIDFKKTVDEVFASRSYYLIEKMAHDIAEKILVNTRIYSIEITIQKPEVLTNGTVGITLTRERKN